MENKTVQPATSLGGTLDVPGDKSISHRAVILGALSTTPTEVYGFLDAEDCLATVEAFRQMGISITRDGNRLSIRGKGLEGLKAPKQPIDCGNSGTTTRLLMGVLTGQPFETELRGDASLSRRPMARVIEPLTKMGANFIPAGGSAPDRLPLRMRGCHMVRSIQWKSPVASAQVKSAILLAGLYASGETSVQEPSLSRDHTERMLRASGVKVLNNGPAVTLFGTATLRATRFDVPADLSSAAFLLAAGALCAVDNVTVRKVGVNPTRTGFIDVLHEMGIFCRLNNSSQSGGEPIADVEIRRSRIKSAMIGGDLIPRAIDEIPVLTVLATQANGETVIRDAGELRVKESDRLTALQQELSKMGAKIEERPDGLIVRGPVKLKGAVVNSHGDHRLAMSLAVAALVAEGPTTIEDVACVNTSFPSFWSQLDALRAH
jgi:3-phosphoshikimate 1-carboxyvinyltransferase